MTIITCPECGKEIADLENWNGHASCGGGMSDYHQRFRERFPVLTPYLEPLAKDILAFVDEELRQRHISSWAEGVSWGRMEERAALISHIEGMKKPKPTIENADFYSVVYQPIYNSALDDLLSHLRTDEKEKAVFAGGGSFGKVKEPDDFRNATEDKKREMLLEVMRDATNDQRKQIGLEPLPDASQAHKHWCDITTGINPGNCNCGSNADGV